MTKFVSAQRRKWKLRQAKAADARAVAECIEAAYSIYRSRITDLPDVTAGVVADIESRRVWVAENEQVIVGAVVLAVKDDVGLLANVAVNPDCSGMGLGRTLVELAESRCLELGLRSMRLTTHVDMPENVRLYEHLHWQETGRTGNKVQMEKDIYPGGH